MKLVAVMLLLALIGGCRPVLSPTVQPDPAPGERMQTNKSAIVSDVHSYSNPQKVRVRHVDLDWTVHFDHKVMRGHADLLIERPAGSSDPLILDTRDLTIVTVSTSSGDGSWSPAEFTLGTPDKLLGAPLTITLPSGSVKRVRVEYETSPGASGLQWMEPSQTAGRKSPFMFTQSQAIHARSWIPVQDSPQVRLTYTAKVRVPPGVIAVMSAENNPRTSQGGEYSFVMRQPIPAYLIALAVGDLAFRATGPRTGIYADPTIVESAAAEFADTEAMIKATESLYGPYRWGRYDLLVLPPSFPFGGMENPVLTFATPTVIAGDRSLVSLVSHELAHSWSGNLVTNATWRDFWLNEGFTVYLERRILEVVYGARRARMEAVLGRRDLDSDLAKLDDRDEILYVDLAGRDPDDGFTHVPYEKGALFLLQLEQTFGRDRFDRFLRGYFDHFAFQSITTADFVTYLRANLLNERPELAATIPLDEWIYGTALPASAPRVTSDAFTTVEQLSARWLSREIQSAALPVKEWTTHEWLHFLSSMPKDLSADRMAELDAAFKLTSVGNSEIAHQWLLMAIRAGYEPAYARVEEYLVSIGRRKLIKPLYEELVKSPAGRDRAQAIYRKARPGYHPIAVTTLDPIVGLK
ncbi:MAG TPA: M1 family metallopeptidase [Thermoanaerobaculia bacterium]|nr:M1 family metallopeptidase [Thermoanaerobaculia bacterium]